jgi:polysaccharide biosynthesis protein PslH
MTNDQPPRLKILYLARHLPVPLDAGDRIYSARLIESIAGAGADVHFLGLVNPDQPDLGPDGLDPSIRWEIIPGPPASAVRALFSNRPVVGAKFGTAAYERRLAELLKQTSYDAIVVDHHGLAWTLPIIERATAGRRPVIAHVAHDFETHVTEKIARAYRGNWLKRLAFQSNARRTAAAELLLTTGSDIVITLTEQDGALFRGIGAKEMVIIPPGYVGPRRPARMLTADIPRHVAIVGSYRWTAKQMNLEDFLAAADGILADAGITLSIIGDAPPELRERWQGRLRAGRFLGFVDDLGEFLDGCRMGLVVEAVGGGFKLKVLDYVFTRTPVAGIAAGLEGQSEDVIDHCVVAPDAAALGKAIVANIDDIELLNRNQDRCFDVAGKLYSWEANGQKILAALSAHLAPR